MRRAILWLHRWCGLVLALYILVVSATGTASVFHDEIASVVRVPHVTPTPQPSLSPDAVVDKLTAAFPDWHLQTLWWPEGPQSPWFAEVRQGSVGAIGETALAVYVHPQTGDILKRHDYGRSSWRWLQLLHFNLLSGRGGRTVNGVLALASIVVVLTGVFIWLPREARAALWKIGQRSGGRRFAWELHQVSGLYVVPFFLLLCLTGAYFAWRTPVHRAIEVVFPMRFMSTAVAPIEPPPVAPLKPLASFLPAVAAQVPGFEVTRVIFPEQPNQPMRFIIYEGSRRDFFKASNLFFHPGNGELLRADLYRDRSSGDSIVHWIGAVHYGAFASWLSKIIWVGSGIGVLVSVISGVWLYGKRLARL